MVSSEPPPMGPRLATCVTESAARQAVLNLKRVIGSDSGKARFHYIIWSAMKEEELRSITPNEKVS